MYSRPPRYLALICFLSLCLLAIVDPTMAPRASAQERTGAVPTDGLVLWLDSSDAAAKLSDGQTEASLAKWQDKSQRNSTLSAASLENQPKLIQVGDDWVVRFDGEDDFLRSTSDKPFSSEALTAFVVAAPHSNVGQFRGLLATNAPQQFDYLSGFNIDLGQAGGFKFDCLNIEGRGFGGAVNLLKSSSDFGQLQIIQLTVDPERKKVSTIVNGQAQGDRPTDGGEISLQETVVGARYFETGNSDQKPFGALAGDIAEVLIYDRLLSKEQSSRIQTYLETKYEELKSALPAHTNQQNGFTLQRIPDPPVVQMVLPGFEVFELPVQLNNINNVRYRPDGKLMALGYDGDIHLLSDSDGDGIEDQTSLFWKSEGRLRGPIGMALTPKDYEKGQGAFVPSKGKVSLIVDTDNDDVADKEIIVATGWPEIFTSVDAVGLCLDDENNIYFGLGVADFSNAYQVGDDGIAKYNRGGENGTIQKVSADFSKRETVCTGIRFPIGMDINQHGDIFCTEQEGATWLPNGNPMDELLWIRPDLHYGFPPRHPRHNPDVIDQPAVAEFGPQHQSTCGMFFNTGVNGGPVFGDPAWKNDAIIVGESRGKIWRTALNKTDSGYLAQSQLIACLQMLTIDSCVAPNGDLIVCCHTGPPDWGTGPTGKGKLFRIRRVENSPPKPVVAWQQSPGEIRIAFDKPIDPRTFAEGKTGSTIHYGKYIRAGDELENLVPPYVAVNRQLATPRFQSPIHTMGLTADRKTMILSSDVIHDDTHIAVSLVTKPIAVGEVEPSGNPGVDAIGQESLISVDVQNQGVLASVENQEVRQSIWLPHMHTAAAQAFTNGSELHHQWFEAASRSETIHLETQLNLYNMLRPAIQPGETIDYQWPQEQVTFEIRSNAKFNYEFGADKGTSQLNGDKATASLTRVWTEDQWLPVKVTVDQTSLSGKELMLQLVYWTNEDSTARVVPIDRLHLPWVHPSKDLMPVVSRQLPEEIEAASWGRGRQVFHGSKAMCFKCHAIDNSGGRIGPELGNLRQRDYESVLRDVLNPSFSINPDYVGTTVLMEDGRTLNGVIRLIDGQQQIGNPEGQWVNLDPNEIEASKPASTSVMPEKLLDKLSQQERDDLFAYLMKMPPSMPLESKLKAPPLRTKPEVARILEGSVEIAEPEALTITLVAGPKDHGPGEHDYPAWQKQWGQLLAAAPNVELQLAWEFPSQEQLDNSDILVFFQKGDWNDERQPQMDRYFSKGGGAVYLHWAVNGNNRAKDFSQRIGLASKAGSVGYRHGPLTLNLHNTDDSIMRNLGSVMELYDESYWELAGDEKEIKLLASSQEEGKMTPQIWTYQPGNGRVFVSIPGHYSWTFDDPVFRILLLRGMAWTADQPVDRFNSLVPLGARIKR